MKNTNCYTHFLGDFEEKTHINFFVANKYIQLELISKYS